MRRNIIRLSGLWRKIDTINGNNQSLSNYQVLIMLTTPPPYLQHLDHFHTDERWEVTTQDRMVILTGEMTIVYLMINSTNNLAFNLSDLPFQYIKT